MLLIEFNSLIFKKDYWMLTISGNDDFAVFFEQITGETPFLSAKSLWEALQSALNG